jgi:hypothetical protein
VAGGKPLNARGLAKRMTGYGVKAKNIRAGVKVFRGYAREDLADAWDRYLPPADGADVADSTSATRDSRSPSPRESATSATSTTSTFAGPLNGAEYQRNEATLRPENGRGQQAALMLRTYPLPATSSAEPPTARTPVADVADVADFPGDGENPFDGAAATLDIEDDGVGEEGIL